MKLDPLFKSENNKLYTLDGTEVPLTNCTNLKAEDCFSQLKENSIGFDGNICLVSLSWSLVGTEDGGYNEESLALLRDWLKGLEEKNKFAIIVPVAGKDDLSQEEKDIFTASMKHSARRVKDCISVVGFSIPSLYNSADANMFIEELSAKHAQYVFFSKNDSILSEKKVVCL